MATKLTIQEQLDVCEKALTELTRLYKKTNCDLFMCWIFYKLLTIPNNPHRICEVTVYIELFTLANMDEHSKTRLALGYINPYNERTYLERKKFIEWMISEYKTMLSNGE